MVGRREKTANVQQQQKGERKRHEANVHGENDKIVAAINRAADEIETSRNEQKSQDYLSNWLEVAGIGGIYIAAGVAIWAILSADSSSERQRSVMQGQLNEMQAEQRPWIYADLSIGGKAYRTQTNGLGFPITFTLHNTGHLPAFYASPDIEGYLSGSDGQSPVMNIRGRQKRRCDSPLQQPEARDQIGITVFPGQTVLFGAVVGISEAEIESVKKNSHGNMIPLVPWGVGCIRYRTQDGAGHQTGVAFSIGMIKPGQPLPFVLPLDPTDVDPQQLIVMPWIEGGTAYAN